MENPAEHQSKILYVGNLPFKSSLDDIKSAFAEHGTVHSIKLIKDRLTGRPRGFCFIQMDHDEADLALAAMNDYEFGGRKLRIEEAKDQTTPVKKRTRKKPMVEGT